MKSVKERKKLRKVKKKWVVVSAGIWVGLLSTIVAATMPELVPKPIRQYIPGLSEKDQKVEPAVQSVVQKILGEQALDQTGQSIKLNDSAVQQLNEVARIALNEQAPDGGPGIKLDQQQIEDVIKVITSENNPEASLQQIVQSAAEIVLDKPNETEAVPPAIQKVVEHVEKIIELPSLEDLELKEELEKTKKEFDEQMAQLRAAEEEKQLLSEKIDADAQALRGREERIDELTALVNERETLLEEREREIAEAENELRDVEDRLEKTDDQTQRAKLKAKISVLKEDIAQKEAAKKELAKKIEINKKELEKHQKAAAKLKQRLDSREDEFRDNEQRIRDLQKQLATTGGDAGEYDYSEFLDKDAPVSDKRDKIKELKTTVDSLSDEIDNLKSNRTPAMLPPLPPGQSETEEEHNERERIARKQQIEEKEEILTKTQKALFGLSMSESELFSELTGTKLISSMEADSKSQKQLMDFFKLKAQRTDSQLDLAELIPEGTKYEFSPFNIFYDKVGEDDGKFLISKLNGYTPNVRKQVRALDKQSKGIWEAMVLQDKVKKFGMDSALKADNRVDVMTLLVDQPGVYIADKFNDKLKNKNFGRVIQENIQTPIFRRKFYNSKVVQPKFISSHFFTSEDSEADREKIQSFMNNNADKNWIGLFRPFEMNAAEWLNFLSEFKANKISQQNEELYRKINEAHRIVGKLKNRWSIDLSIHRQEEGFDAWLNELKEYELFADNVDRKFGIDEKQEMINSLESLIQEKQSAAIAATTADSKARLYREFRELTIRMMTLINDVAKSENDANKEMPKEFQILESIEGKLAALSFSPPRQSSGISRIAGFTFASRSTAASSKGKFGVYVGNLRGDRSISEWNNVLSDWQNLNLSDAPEEVKSLINKKKAKEELDQKIKDIIASLQQKFIVKDKLGNQSMFLIELDKFKEDRSNNDWYDLLQQWNGLDENNPSEQIAKELARIRKLQEIEDSKDVNDKADDEAAMSSNDPMEKGLLKSKEMKLNAVIKIIQDKFLRNPSLDSIKSLRSRGVKINNWVGLLEDWKAELAKSSVKNIEDVSNPDLQRVINEAPVFVENLENQAIAPNAEIEGIQANAEGNIQKLRSRFAEIDEKIKSQDDANNAKVQLIQQLSSQGETLLNSMKKLLTEGILPSQDEMNLSLTEADKNGFKTELEELNNQLKAKIIDANQIVPQAEQLNLDLTALVSSNDLSALDKFEKLSETSQNLISLKNEIRQTLNRAKGKLEQRKREIGRAIDEKIKRLNYDLVLPDNSRLGVSELKRQLGVDYNKPKEWDDKLKQWVSNDIYVKFPPELSALNLDFERGVLLQEIQTEYKLTNFVDLTQEFIEFLAKSNDVKMEQRLLLEILVEAKINKFSDAKNKGYKYRQDYFSALLDTQKKRINENNPNEDVPNWSVRVKSSNGLTMDKANLIPGG